jgi:hypothetical protein
MDGKFKFSVIFHAINHIIQDFQSGLFKIINSFICHSNSAFFSKSSETFLKIQETISFLSVFNFSIKGACPAFQSNN